MSKILIAEDEIPINNLVKKNLTLVGHDCKQAYDGQQAVEMAAEEHFDLLILDVMLPKLSGFEVIGQIENLPVIFLTARSNLSDRILGLKLGGDDYLTKPFEMQELLARVEAVLRRTQGVSRDFAFGEIRVDFSSRKVWRKGEEIPLKPKEFDLLECLIVNRNIALSRERLISLVWGFDFEGDSRTVDVHIGQLRQKLGLRDEIRTVYKTGYRLEIPGKTGGGRT